MALPPFNPDYPLSIYSSDAVRPNSTPLPLETLAKIVVELFSVAKSPEEIKKGIDPLTATSDHIKALAKVISSDEFLPIDMIYPTDEHKQWITSCIFAYILDRSSTWAESSQEDRQLAQLLYSRTKGRIDGMLNALRDLYPNKYGAQAEFAQSHLSVMRALKDVSLYYAYHLKFDSRNLLVDTHHEIPDLECLTPYFEDLAALSQNSSSADLAVDFVNKALYQLNKRHILLPYHYIKTLLNQYKELSDTTKEPQTHDGVLAVLFNNTHYIPADVSQDNESTDKVLYRVAIPRLQQIFAAKGDCHKGRLINRQIEYVSRFDDPALLMQFIKAVEDCGYTQSPTAQIQEAKLSVTKESIDELFREVCVNSDNAEVRADYLTLIKDHATSNLIPITVAKHIYMMSVNNQVPDDVHLTMTREAIKALQDSGLRAFILVGNHIMDLLGPLHAKDPTDPCIALTLYAMIPSMASVRPAFSTRVEEALEISNIRTRFYKAVLESASTIFLRTSVDKSKPQNELVLQAMKEIIDGCTRTVDTKLQRELFNTLSKLYPTLMDTKQFREWMKEIEARFLLHTLILDRNLKSTNNKSSKYAIKTLAAIDPPINKRGSPLLNQHIISLISRNHILYALEDPHWNGQDLENLLPRLYELIAEAKPIRYACFEELGKFFSQDLKNLSSKQQKDERHAFLIPRLRALIRGAKTLQELPSNWTPLLNAI